MSGAEAAVVWPPPDEAKTGIVAEATTFAKSYAALFSSPAASVAEQIPALTEEISKYYRPGITMFSGGKILPLATQKVAGELIESHMLKNVALRIGTKLVLNRIEKIEPCSETSALCWLNFSFHPRGGSEFEGRGWTFTDVYLYRAESSGKAAGWEFVITDQETSEMKKATGKTFEPE